MLQLRGSELIHVSKTHFEFVVDIVAKAFFNDPLMTFLFPDEKTRISGSRIFFDLMVKHVFRYGEVIAIKKDTINSPSNGEHNPYAAVSLWYHGKAAFGSIWSYIRVGGLKWLFVPFRKRLFALLSLLQQTELNHKTLVNSNHYYLSILGADPLSKGKGYISRLLKPIYSELDSLQIPIYLETMLAQNVGLYEHLGFKNVGEVDIPQFKLHVWSLLRNP